MASNTASASLRLQFNVTPNALAPGVSDASAGLTAAEAMGLDVQQGEVFFHRVFDPANADFASGGSGPMDGFNYGNFPSFTNNKTGSPAPVQDWEGADLDIGFLRLLAVRIQRKVEWTPAYASVTVASDNTNVSDGEQVVLGSVTYTFKTTLAGVTGQVKIGANADATLTNLGRAVNYTGTPGTDYVGSAENPDVEAAPAVTAEHTLTFTARASGPDGNTLAATTNAVHLSFKGVNTFQGGSLVAEPRTPMPIGGTIGVKLSNGVLPDPAGAPGTSVLEAEFTSPGLFVLATDESWLPDTSGTIEFLFSSLSINAICTLLLIGSPSPP